ncbi:MAG: metallophosphoesterase [Treponema sp.]|nr:metallophosphoesterase [Treponema sp.]
MLAAEQFTSEQCESLRRTIASYRDNDRLPSEEELIALLDRTISTLESESVDYRAQASDGSAGGLLDFSADTLPVIIVPDLHARPDFIVQLLDCTFEGMSLLSALATGRLYVVCVGDGVHTESPVDSRDRWIRSYQEWMERGNINSEPMQQEMKDCFSTMMAVMELKNAFPKHFHFLKGNHENILNKEGGGDHPFRKYALEGAMVKEFVGEQYGDAVLHLMNCFETNLPIVAVFRDFGISHAEPMRPYARNEIVNYHDNGDLILDFTWTSNDQAEENSCARQFCLLTGKEDDGISLWFGGHRPVEGKYKLRQNGRYIQIHNPMEMNIAVVASAQSFNPDEDIISIVI